MSLRTAAFPALAISLVALVAGPARAAGTPPAPATAAPATHATVAPATAVPGAHATVAPAHAVAPGGGSTAAAVAAPVAPRASLTSIESEVMCVTCGVPLDIAESPQADHERAYIRDQIARGRTADQIKQALVAQLGPGVLALPSQSGFNLAVYLVPVILILALAGGLAVVLPRWRRPGGTGEPPDAPGLTQADDARLDAELASFDA